VAAALAMTDTFSSQHAPAVVDTWHRFRVHADDCERCVRASKVVLKGGDHAPSFPALHLMTCPVGQPPIEQWGHAVETYMESVRERVGKTRRLA
jgi:hypothetical protein